MSKRGVILLALLLGACEREEARPPARQPAKHSPREKARATGDSAREAKIRTEELAAARDPELQRLLRPRHNDPFLDSESGPDPGPIATLYGERYPQAGIRWLLSKGPEFETPWWNFAKAVYTADPEAAFRTLDQLPPAAREQFANGLCQAASAADRERLWEITRADDANFDIPRMLHWQLILNQARSDITGAWQIAQDRMGEPCDERLFLSGLSDLDPGTAYPSALLDRIAPGDLDVILMTGLQACRTRNNVEPIRQWLAAQPPSPELDSSYVHMAGWEAAYGDAAKARGWSEKITDPVSRERAIRALPGAAAH